MVVICRKARITLHDQRAAREELLHRLCVSTSIRGGALHIYLKAATHADRAPRTTTSPGDLSRGGTAKNEPTSTAEQSANAWLRRDPAAEVRNFISQFAVELAGKRGLYAPSGKRWLALETLGRNGTSRARLSVRSRLKNYDFYFIA